MKYSVKMKKLNAINTLKSFSKMFILNLIFTWFEDLHELLVLILETSLRRETLQFGLSVVHHGLHFVSEQQEGVLQPRERRLPHHENFVLDVTFGDLSWLNAALSSQFEFRRLDFLYCHVIFILVVFELLSVI